MRRRTPRRSRRGLTLIELVIGVVIAVFLTAAAVAFAAHETKLMGFSRDSLDLSQSSRASLDLLAADLAMAGGGVGFDSTETFLGFDAGPFTIAGCQFNQDGATLGFDPGPAPPPGAHTAITLRTVGPEGTRPASYSTRTTDLLIRYADGAYASIADYNSTVNSGQHCFAPDIRFGPNELVLLRHESQSIFTAVQINSTNAASGCSTHPCGSDPLNPQCVNFTFTPTTLLNSSPSAPTENYLNGEIAGGLKSIVWFVASDGQDGTLRRAVFDDPTDLCAARDNTLGGAVADNVEAMQVQVYQFIGPPIMAAPQWVNIGQTPPNGAERWRTRIDLEVVMRNRSPAPGPKQPVPFMLQTNLCAPNTGSCTTAQDHGDRYVYRTSVEVKNSGLFR